MIRSAAAREGSRALLSRRRRAPGRLGLLEQRDNAPAASAGPRPGGRHDDAHDTQRPAHAAGAYSASDIQAMDDAFTKHTEHHINPELVSYDSLHDKIVTAQVGGNGKYDVVLMDTPCPPSWSPRTSSPNHEQDPGGLLSGVFDSAWTPRSTTQDLRRAWINDTKFFFYNSTC